MGKVHGFSFAESKISLKTVQLKEIIMETIRMKKTKKKCPLGSRFNKKTRRCEKAKP